MDNMIFASDNQANQITKVAYNAYGEYRKWKTHDDKSMPQWDELSDAIKEAWRVAIYSAFRKYFMG